MPSETLIRARELGQVPDWAWYQLNGKTAQENYVEQQRAKSRKFREDILKRRAAKAEEDDEPINLVIESKVKK